MRDGAPVVSVVMPLFNAEPWVNGTLSSIEAQSMANWELVAVNDGSTDGSVNIVRMFADRVDQEVTIIDIPNSGPSVARNTGIARARGEFIALIDADDLWNSDKLRDQVDLLSADPSAVAAICDYVIQEGLDGPIAAHRHFTWSARSLEAWALMEDASPCLNSTLLVRRSVLDRIGPFRDEMTNVEDLELAYRLEEAGAVLNTNREQMTYRMHESQNHKNRTTIIRDYRVFLDQWSGVSTPIRQRGYANVLLLEASENWKAGQWGMAVGCGIRSLGKAPLQWVRLLRGIRRRRREGRPDGR